MSAYSKIAAGLREAVAHVRGMSTASNDRGQEAVSQHPGPSHERSIHMATVSAIAPKNQVSAATIHWLNECMARGSREQFVARTVIVPGVAAAILKNNPNNRNLSEKKVAEYARDMLSGRWAFNGEPIIIADTGELNDGQHRLQAVIDSNRPQDFFIVFGMARETRATIDQGLARTAGHYLAMHGVESSKACASIAGLVMAYETTAGRSLRDRRTHAEIVDRVLSDDAIGAAAHFSNTVQRFCKGLLTPAQIGCCHYLFSAIDPIDANEYLTQVCVGERIKRGDPAFAARQALTNIKGEQRIERLEVTFRGWNAYRQRRKLKVAKTYSTLPALV